MLKRGSIKARLLILLGFSILNVAAVGCISIYYLDSVVKTYDRLTEQNIPALRAVNEARNAQRSLVILDSNIVASDHSYKDADKAQSEYAEFVRSYEAATEQYHKIPVQEGEAKIRRDVDTAWIEFAKASHRVINLAGSSDPKDLALRFSISVHELADARKHFRESFAELTEFHDKEARKWEANAKASAVFAKIVLIGVTLITSIILLLIGAAMANDLSRTLASISEKIATASSTTTRATQEVSAASEQLASSSTQQASSIQETAAAMEEISAMVSKNAASADSTRSISLDSQQKAIDGKSVVMAMVDAIEKISQSNVQIAKQIETSNREMTEITNVISEIENKTKVINDIVFQTKLLSFNASVEAARAGEHGKGFAVVAEEVGNLAQMSGTASQSITEILRQGTQRVKDIIDRSSSQIASLMNDNKAKVKSGADTAERCKHVLEELVDNVTQVSEMASSIAVASQEQSHGIREVNSAVSQFGTVVSETNSSSQTLSSASLALVTQTEAMNNVVRQLAAVVKGESKAA